VVSSATVNSVAATGMTVANDGKKTESTTINFATIPANATVLVSFAAQTTAPVSPIRAQFVSCTATQASGNNKPVLLNNVVWSYPWVVTP
jgi:hypothetical protein